MVLSEDGQCGAEGLQRRKPGRSLWVTVTIVPGRVRGARMGPRPQGGVRPCPSSLIAHKTPQLNRVP